MDVNNFPRERRQRRNRSGSGASPELGQSPSDLTSELKAALAERSIWLRFPAGLESQFHADTLESRRQLLGACGLIGCIGVCVGSSNLKNLTPDIALLVWQLVWVWLLVTVTGFAARRLGPMIVAAYVR